MRTLRQIEIELLDSIRFIMMTIFLIMSALSIFATVVHANFWYIGIFESIILFILTKLIEVDLGI